MTINSTRPFLFKVRKLIISLFLANFCSTGIEIFQMQILLIVLMIDYPGQLREILLIGSFVTTMSEK